jgi:hypothetical protein
MFDNTTTNPHVKGKMAGKGTWIIPCSAIRPGLVETSMESSGGMAHSDRTTGTSGGRWISAVVMVMVGFGLLGAILAEDEVPLQFNSGGYTSFVHPLLAAVVFPLSGYVTLLFTQGSFMPWIRWLGRILVVFLLIFEVLAFLHASHPSP